MAERYLVGHMEEKVGDLDVMSPQSPSRCCAARVGADTWVEYEAPTGKLRVRVHQGGDRLVPIARAAVPPKLPPGAAMDLPGRGTTFVRTLDGPLGAPTVVLLHGWTATADLNWFTCYQPLAEHFRVVALDHRGHGRGIRSRKIFRLEDCADDAVAVCDVLGIDSFIPVGYSMGGPIAQLIWQRHRQRVAGLVLCATSAYFSTSREER